MTGNEFETEVARAIFYMEIAKLELMRFAEALYPHMMGKPEIVSWRMAAFQADGNLRAALAAVNRLRERMPVTSEEVANVPTAR